MELEVLLSVMNLKKEDLDKMNITSSCIVINQCDRNEYEEYKNFKIYSYNQRGISKSRNKALRHSTKDILLFCDDDVIYNKDYEKIILDEFKNNPKADVIFFNFDSPNRKVKQHKKSKRLHIYNSLRYGAYNIAVKRNSIANINFNQLFGSKEHYHSGEDTMFIVDCLKNKLKLYSSTKNIGTVYHLESTWFKGYDEKYFFDKGALFTAINKNIRHLLFFQYLLRYRNILTNISFIKAYKLMIKGSNSYLEKVNNV